MENRETQPEKLEIDKNSTQIQFGQKNSVRILALGAGSHQDQVFCHLRSFKDAKEAEDELREKQSVYPEGTLFLAQGIDKHELWYHLKIVFDPESVGIWEDWTKFPDGEFIRKQLKKERGK